MLARRSSWRRAQGRSGRPGDRRDDPCTPQAETAKAGQGLHRFTDWVIVLNVADARAGHVLHIQGLMRISAHIAAVGSVSEMSRGGQPFWTFVVTPLSMVLALTLSDFKATSPTLAIA